MANKFKINNEVPKRLNIKDINTDVYHLDVLENNVKQRVWDAAKNLSIYLTNPSYFQSIGYSGTNQADEAINKTATPAATITVSDVFLVQPSDTNVTATAKTNTYEYSYSVTTPTKDNTDAYHEKWYITGNRTINTYPVTFYTDNGGWVHTSCSSMSDQTPFKEHATHSVQYGSTISRSGNVVTVNLRDGAGTMVHTYVPATNGNGYKYGAVVWSGDSGTIGENGAAGNVRATQTKTPITYYIKYDGDTTSTAVNYDAYFTTRAKQSKANKVVYDDQQTQTSTVTLTFNENYTGAPAATTATGTKTIKSTPWTEYDYTWVGWEANINGSKSTLTASSQYKNLTQIDELEIPLSPKFTEGIYDVGIRTDSITNPSFSLPTKTRTGYTHTSWNKNSTGTSTSYSLDAKHSFGNNTILYAQWKENTYSIVFDLDGAKTTSTTPDIVKNGKSGIKYTQTVTIPNLSSTQITKDSVSTNGTTSAITAYKGKFYYIRNKAVGNISVSSSPSVLAVTSWMITSDSNKYVTDPNDSSLRYPKYSGYIRCYSNSSNTGSALEVKSTDFVNFSYNGYTTNNKNYYWDHWEDDSGFPWAEDDDEAASKLTDTDNGLVTFTARWWEWNSSTYNVASNGTIYNTSEVTCPSDSDIRSPDGYTLDCFYLRYIDSLNDSNILDTNTPESIYGSSNCVKLYKTSGNKLVLNDNYTYEGQITNTSIATAAKTHYEKVKELGYKDHEAGMIESINKPSLVSGNYSTTGWIPKIKPITYTITYAGNEGTVSGQTSYSATWNTIFTVNKSATRSTLNNQTKTENKNVTITVTYKPDAGNIQSWYSVTGNRSETHSITYHRDYTHAGWSFTNKVNNKSYNIGTTGSVLNLTKTNGDTVTLNARWSYVDTTDNDTITAFTNPTFTLPSPSKAGYLFKWTSGGNNYVSGTTVTLGSNTTFIGEWTAKKYIINYADQSEDGIRHGTECNSATYDSYVSIPFAYKDNVEVPGTSNEYNNGYKEYELTFYSANTSNATNFGTNTVWSTIKRVKPNDYYSYDFQGWTTYPEGQPVDAGTYIWKYDYAPSITLKAVFEEEFVQPGYSNSGSEIPGSYTLSSSSIYEYNDDDVYFTVSPGYRITGFTAYDASNGAVFGNYNPGDTINNINKNLTIIVNQAYIQYKVKYTGGTTNPSTQTCTYNSFYNIGAAATKSPTAWQVGISLKDAPYATYTVRRYAYNLTSNSSSTHTAIGDSTTYSRTVYTFNQWKGTINGTQNVFSAGQKNAIYNWSTTHNATITLTAQFTNEYDTKTEWGTISYPTYTFPTTDSLSSYAPSEGYHFIGWNVNTNMNVIGDTFDYAPGGSVQLQDNMNVYPVYSRNTYSLTFNLDGSHTSSGATTIDAKECRYGLTYYFPAATIKDDTAPNTSTDTIRYQYSIRFLNDSSSVIATIPTTEGKKITTTVNHKTYTWAGWKYIPSDTIYAARSSFSNLTSANNIGLPFKAAFTESTVTDSIDVAETAAIINGNAYKITKSGYKQTGWEIHNFRTGTSGAVNKLVLATFGTGTSERLSQIGTMINGTYAAVPILEYDPYNNLSFTLLTNSYITTQGVPHYDISVGVSNNNPYEIKIYLVGQVYYFDDYKGLYVNSIDSDMYSHQTTIPARAGITIYMSGCVPGTPLYYQLTSPVSCSNKSTGITTSGSADS